MAPNIYNVLMDVILKKNFWNITTIKTYTRQLWMNNRHILEDEEQILLRHLIVELRKLVYDWRSDFIPSHILIRLFNSNVAMCLHVEEIRSQIISNFRNQDEII